MKRVAAIDCGTNSIRLLIADCEARAAADRGASGGRKPAEEMTLRDQVREMRIVRLGEGVDHTGRLSQAAIDRTLAALSDYRDLIEKYGIEEDSIAKDGVAAEGTDGEGARAIRFVATSAMRDASNGVEVLTAIENVLGVAPEIIPGSEEAALSFQGALSSLAAAPAAPTLLVDVGGGSTEFVIGTGDGAEADGAGVAQSISVDMGSVRVTERFHVKPGDREATRRAAGWVDEQLDRVEDVIDFGAVGALVGVAGTVTTLAAWALGVDEYDPDRTHGQFLTWDQWDRAARFMIDAPIEEKAQLNFMPPGRADVIGAGALIWERVLHRLRARSVAAGRDLGGAFVSEHDVLDGIALSIATRNC